MLEFSIVAGIASGFQAGKSMFYTAGGLIKKALERMHPPELIDSRLKKESKQATCDIQYHAAKTLLYGFCAYNAVARPDPINVLVSCVALAETIGDIECARRRAT
ncbi:MAG: hypothetical protein AB7I18_10065 [Candidatus Berkiella sp.]